MKSEKIRISSLPPSFARQNVFFIAAQQFLAARGIRVPHDVSLVCNDYHPNLEWCVPAVAHIYSDKGPIVRRIVRWANHVDRGENDRRHVLSKATFVEGGTIGPARH